MSEPAENQLSLERRALRVSLYVSVVIAVGALVLGVVTGTRIIIFDGAYMGIGLLLSAASLRASSISAQAPSRRFPFGRAALTPLMVLIQGGAIAGTLLFAAGDAVVIIQDGGSDTSPLVIAVYGAVTAALGFVVVWWLRRIATGSDLVEAEVAQWRAGAVLSAIMLVGAGAAALLAAIGWGSVARYTDPVLVLVACATLASIPIRLIRSGLNELLEGAAPPVIQSAVEAAVDSVRNQLQLPRPSVRAGKVGRKLYVEVDFVVSGAQWDINDEDTVRRAIQDSLGHLGMEIWANVSLTADPDLIE